VHSNGYAFQVEMNYRAVRLGQTVVEIPITFEERTLGSSKLSLAVQLESAVLPWRLRLTRRRSRTGPRARPRRALSDARRASAYLSPLPPANPPGSANPP
jgi:hypothetical protein